MYKPNQQGDHVRWLLRALLRECTYLPDPHARLYVHNLVLARFRASQRPINQTSIVQRRATLIKKGYAILKTLNRANQGHSWPLHKILQYTYGRIGPRRHQILDSLRTLGSAQDAKTSQAVASKVPVPGMPEIIYTLGKSQLANHTDFFPVRNIRSLSLEIPSKNAWGRPFPACRIRNMQRKFNARFMKRLLPPLPADEWEQLRKRITGEIPFEGQIRRRRQSSDSMPGLVPYFAGLKLSRPHRITTRFMRRQWQRIFFQTPIIKQNPVSSKWIVEWGGPRLTVNWGSAFQSQTKLYGLFDGVDEKGKRLR